MISCGLFLVEGFLQNHGSVCVEADPPREEIEVVAFVLPKL